MNAGDQTRERLQALLFNRAFRDFMAVQFKQPQAFLLGLTVDDVQPLMSAPPALMRHTLDTIRAVYGSVEGYLESKAGVDDSVIAALKENLLE